MTDIGAPDRRPGGAQIIPRPAAWREGDPPPWAGRTIDHLPTEAVLAAVPPLAAEPRLMRPAFPDARPSAVLIALHDGPLGAEVLLTRRSWELRNHKGEISFPGGRMEPGETAVDAALREAHEEVTLDPTLVRVHGELDHLDTVVSRSYIVPVVARLEGRPELRPGTSEVDRILFVPLVELLRPDTYREERWGSPPLDRPIHFFELDDETIWGATGRMLVQLLTLATAET